MDIIKKLLFAIIVVGLITGCSKDEEVTPEQELQQASLEFDAQNPPVEVPSGLQSSDAPQEAKTISSYLSLVNTLTSYNGLFEPPAGAETSNTPITTGTSGGRVAASQANVLVYTWSSSDQQGNTVTVAYQITDNGDAYLFELFYKYNTEDFFKILEGAESKDDLREGYLEWFSYDGGTDYVLRYEWSEDADGNFTFNYLTDTFRLNIEVAANNSGSINYYENDVLLASYTWNATGTAGTYTSYDEQGNATTTEWTSGG